jgi:hypothetical protein
LAYAQFIATKIVKPEGRIKLCQPVSLPDLKAVLLQKFSKVMLPRTEPSPLNVPLAAFTKTTTNQIIEFYQENFSKAQMAQG